MVIENPSTANILDLRSQESLEKIWVIAIIHLDFSGYFHHVHIVHFHHVASYTDESSTSILHIQNPWGAPLVHRDASQFQEAPSRAGWRVTETIDVAHPCVGAREVKAVILRCWADSTGKTTRFPTGSIDRKADLSCQARGPRKHPSAPSLRHGEERTCQSSPVLPSRPDEDGRCFLTDPLETSCSLEGR